MPEPGQANIDRRGRICDPQGRPLRNKELRSSTGAFRGQPGGEHPGSKRLKARQTAFDADRVKTGRRRPGSLKKK